MAWRFEFERNEFVLAENKSQPGFGQAECDGAGPSQALLEHALHAENNLSNMPKCDTCEFQV